jgi:serine phosphatase RsbU (regulator of sigma subunit)
VFVAFTLKLSPARRSLYLLSLVIALVGVVKLFRNWGTVSVPFGTPFFNIVMIAPQWADGAFALFISILLINLLLLLEVADRLSLKGELEVAREIQLAMLPTGTYKAGNAEICGVTRPANTVGGDFYDVLPIGGDPNGPVIVTIGDVAGKGSPAALLMALLLAVLRTLVDERLDPCALVSRLNTQICRHSPGSRFITLFYGVYDPSNGVLTYVNAGHTQPLVLRSGGTVERLTEGGIALGMFEHSSYSAGQVTIAPDELVAIYSDGITEAENPEGRPFDERGLEDVLTAERRNNIAAIGSAVAKAVEIHTADTRLADDLTLLLLRCSTMPAPAGV